jgi:chloramphenicol-sensitive protein RarD
MSDERALVSSYVISPGPLRPAYMLGENELAAFAFLFALSKMHHKNISQVDEHAKRHGFFYALSAYISWGLLPLFFRTIREVPATQTLAHRVVWSVLFLVLLLSMRGGWSAARNNVRGSRWPLFMASTLLLSANWLMYIWAINTAHVLEASLGYFINPLVNVILGVVFLHESLARPQKVAVGLAAVGVLVLVVGLGTWPWISLALAGSFGLYGFVRKKLDIEPMAALLVETVMMLPFALGYLLYLNAEGTGAFGTAGLEMDLLLAATGIITTLPLLWFAHGVRRLPLSTMGLIQYTTPTCQFLLAVFLFGESFTTWHAIAFACIWAALAIYSLHALKVSR